MLGFKVWVKEVEGSFNDCLHETTTSLTWNPLLGVCILRTTTYWGCESTVLRRSVESRGIQCVRCAL